jgi:hypothetical protein
VSLGNLEHVTVKMLGTSDPALQNLIPGNWNPQEFSAWFSADLSGEEEEAQQVTVKFAQQETERKKRARERSFGYLSQKSAEEPWFHTEFHNSHSEKAEVCGQSVAENA